MDLFVDVSNNNGPTVNFDAIKKAGAKGVYLKVTEGTSFVDPDYPANYARAKKAGLKIGGYHFGHPSNNPAQEAAFFLSHLKLGPGDLLPALDLETADNLQGAEAVHNYAAAFVGVIHGKTGAWPVRYGGSYFFKANGVDTLPGPAWIASYGAPPAGKWDAWQFTDGQPQYPGSIAKLDTSRTLSIWLIVHKAPLHKKVPAHIKKYVHNIRWILAHAYWRAARKFHIGKKPSK